MRLAPHTPVYMYYMTYTLGYLDRWAPSIGAHHAAEIAYVFNLDYLYLYETDFEMADLMVNFWAAFARSGGDPNAHGNSTIVTWPKHSGQKSAEVLDIHILPTTFANHKTEECDVWDEIDDVSKTAHGLVEMLDSI